MDQVLVKDDKYRGKYLAMRDFDKYSIIASDADPVKVHEKAVKKGCKDPVIIYVPEKDMVQIY
jgi:hypothetical protein